MHDEELINQGQQPGWRRNPGKAGFYRGVGALAVAAAGDFLGFVIPWAVGYGQSRGVAPMVRVVFVPAGGFVSLFLAIVAICIGRKVKRHIEGLSEAQLVRLGFVMDIEKEKKLASIGVILGAVSIIVNPLAVFVLVLLLRL